METQVSTIAELKTYGSSMSEGDSVEVLGYTTAGDGGEGTFYWDASSTATDNIGTIIQATGVTTGRWVRIYKGAIQVDWFGAVGDGIVDDTAAFKACSVYAESLSEGYPGGMEDAYSHPHIVIHYGMNKKYRVIGDNPCGIQSTVVDSSFYIEVDGNQSLLAWEPTLATDALFSKLGRNVIPRYSRLKIDTNVDHPNTPTGSIFRSATGEGDAKATWRNGRFIDVAIDTNVDTVFDIDNDTGSTANDTTLVESFICRNITTFLRIAEAEAVDWKIHKCVFGNYSPNAKFFVIGEGGAGTFSGGLTIDSCEILMQNDAGSYDNPTLIYNTCTSNALTPIKIINSRLETRGNDAWRLIDATQGHYVIEGLSYTTGLPSGNVHPDTRLAVIGDKASIEISNCTMPAFITATLPTAPITNVMIKAENSVFNMNRAVDGSGILAAIAYPIIYWEDGGTTYSMREAIVAGFTPRRVEINSPRITASGDSFYGGKETNSKNYQELYLHLSDGSTGLDFVGKMVPNNVVITSMKLFQFNVDVAKVDRIRIRFQDRKSVV